ncbi:unnamed protein product [Rotaria sordida]|uniref:Uncharacterized protein n=1 Tax=Rotaria sordida TaxID=392033 RepID=A0A814UH48_9BILA|nr:unnamed protein product [Rotaria sordida]CAF4177477.1 unnamed protein product [Rotaria sordida]
MRSNDRWHEISHALQNGHVFFTEDKKTHSFGYAGESEFTSLAFVDRGTSFMSYTLHTIYHGAFVRTKDFFKIESSNKQPWSIARFLPLINLDLQNIRYPSTTTRAPRRYLSASVHGTKRLGSELLTNLQLFQQTYFASKTHCSSSNLSTFIEYLETKKSLSSTTNIK